MEDHDRGKTTRLVWTGWLPIVALLVFAVVLLAPPHDLLDKTEFMASAVCHRIAEHSFVVGGRQLPLCARCTGTFLGAAAGLGTLALRRRRAGLFPACPILVVCGLFTFAWAFDGINSLLTLLPGAPYLYEPRNLLRLITGALQGLTVAAVMLPAANQALWASPAAERSVTGLRDLFWLLLSSALVVGLVFSGWPPLLYPLAILSGLAVVGMWGLVNAMLLLAVLRREGLGTRPRDLLAPLSAGITLALAELAAAAVLRSALTQRWGLSY